MNRVGAVVLAAGLSRRLGGSNKLVENLGGTPMVAHVVNSVLQSRARPVVVVTGHEAALIETALAGRDVVFAHNPSYRDGLSTSVKTGIQILAARVEGAVVCLGDMPRVRHTDMDTLIDEFERSGGRTICVPVHEGQRGNPVLWPARFFPELLQLTGDKGARDLLGLHADDVSLVEIRDPGVTLDVDTPQMLQAVRNGNDD